MSDYVTLFPPINSWIKGYGYNKTLNLNILYPFVCTFMYNQNSWVGGESIFEELMNKSLSHLIKNNKTIDPKSSMNPSIRNPKKITPKPNIVKLLIMNKEEILKAARKKN